MKQGGGIGARLLFKLLGVIGFFILVGMLLVPTIGAKQTASLYGTTAVVGGISTGITGASIPTYASNVVNGWNLVKGAPPAAPTLTTNATPEKVPNCTKKQRKATPDLCA